ncbi:MAG: TSUP family transporter [Chitinivibrionales bacterium]|nr:TSUP family transporter [Chitinivibrionales bacterium]
MGDIDIVKLALLFGAGLIAGFINVVAGGGSLITLPALIFYGLPPTVANGTNRIAILLQNVTSIHRFRQKGYWDPALGLKLAVPATAGAIVGSRIAVDIPEQLFRIILSVVMVLVLVLMLFRPKRKAEETEERPLTPGRQAALVAAFFGVGLYGGFIQAGVGFIIMTALSLLTGATLVRINSLKVFLVAFYTVWALIVFVVNGKVAVAAGLVLAAGNSIGAWLSTTLSVSKGDRLIRVLFVVAVVAMTIKVSGLWAVIRKTVGW